MRAAVGKRKREYRSLLRLRGREIGRRFVRRGHVEIRTDEHGKIMNPRNFKGESGSGPK